MSLLTGLIDYVAGILSSLGVNSSFFIQLVIFFVTYLAMYFIAFKPYMAALDERRRRTKGSTDKANDLTLETQKIRETFAREAKEINGDIKSIYSLASEKGMSEKNKIVQEAKSSAETYVSSKSKELESAIGEARAQLEKDVPSISKSIEEKFLRS